MVPDVQGIRGQEELCRNLHIPHSRKTRFRGHEAYNVVCFVWSAGLFLARLSLLIPLCNIEPVSDCPVLWTPHQPLDQGSHQVLGSGSDSSWTSCCD